MEEIEILLDGNSHGGARGEEQDVGRPRQDECGTSTMGAEEDYETKEGRRVRSDKVDLLERVWDEFQDMGSALLALIDWAKYQTEDSDRNPFESEEMKTEAIKAIESASEQGSAVAFFEASNEKDWALSFTTNAFRDREGEIFSTDSIKKYVERHEGEDVKGNYLFWHMPGAKFADIKWQGTVGRFLVEAGPFDNTPVGQAFKNFFREHPYSHPEIAPEGWGCSHKYEYKTADRGDRVYDWFEKNETTILPSSVAANQHNVVPFSLREVKMNEKQREALEMIGGGELVDMVETIGEKATEELEGTVSYKSERDFAADVREIAEDVSDDSLKEQLGAVADELKDTYPEPEEKEVEDLSKRLETLSSELEGESADRLKKIAEDLTGSEKADDEDEYEYPYPESEKELEEFYEAVHDAFGTVIEKFQTEQKEIRESIGTLAEATNDLQAEVKELKRGDEEKIAEKTRLTPAASLTELVESAVGAKETEVDEGDSLSEAGPEETEVPEEGPFFSQWQQRQRTG